MLSETAWDDIVFVVVYKERKMVYYSLLDSEAKKNVMSIILGA